LQTAPDGEENYLPAEEVQKLLEVASRFRGNVINETIFIEDKLHKYLASHCRDGSKKSDELRKMTIERKARRFRSVVAKNDVPDAQDNLIYLAHGSLMDQFGCRPSKVMRL
jgi:hypothetical protein